MRIDGLFGPYDYDNRYLQPEEPKEERSEEWVFLGGRWVYKGEE